MSRDDLASRFSSRVKPDQKVRMSLCIKLKFTGWKVAVWLVSDARTST
jgi:hypothetical protein